MEYDDRRRAIICDVDNTILDMTHRFHYLDGDKTNWDVFLAEETIMQDKPMWNTVTVVGCLAKFYPILFVSGRNEGIREITLDQIHSLFAMCPLLNGYELFLRKDGDWRSDIEIKKEIYTEQIEPNYSIIAAFDDKSSVVELWRSLGITTYHTGELATGDGF